MTRKLDEKFEADHTDGKAEIEDVDAEGGKVEKRLADKVSAITEADKIDSDKEELGEDKSEDMKSDKEDKKSDKEDMKSDKDDEDEDEDEDEDDEDLKEAFGSLFKGETLSEEFKAKLSTIFVASVNEAAHNRAAKLNEKYKKSLAEEVEASVKALTENVEKYIDYTAETYIAENALAIETGLKVELAESFINSLKATFIEHNITIDETKLDLVEELEAEVVSLKNDKNKIENKYVDLTEEVRQLKADKTFAQISEGLTDVERDRLAVLSEKLSTKDIEAYGNDLSVLKESFFKVSTKTSEEVEEVNTLIEDTNHSVKIEDESVAAIMNALSAIKRK